MRSLRQLLPTVAVMLAGTAAVFPAQVPADVQSASGLRKELVQQLDDAEQKFVALAQAVPQEKYSWRPAPGVRSVSEVYMHMAGANFMFPGIAGVKRAPGVALARDMETSVTNKAQVVDMLRKSFAYAKQAVMDVPEAEMNGTVSMFGQQATRRGVLLVMATHAHEHLGQSIAYARMNGVVPPWSRSANGGDR